MNDQNESLIHARALRAEILGAPTVWLPRREVMVDWLNDFVERAEAPAFALGETESADLIALSAFLRKKKVPTTEVGPAATAA